MTGRAFSTQPTPRSRRTETSGLGYFGLMFLQGRAGESCRSRATYDMQRILATRNPREACMMNGWVNHRAHVPGAT